uniref:Uncharacterized protein n=1 Tax=Ascaris lumbricoides TaxID=6252 RepID=A0A9J2P672_ASCLU
LGRFTSQKAHQYIAVDIQISSLTNDCVIRLCSQRFFFAAIFTLDRPLSLSEYYRCSMISVTVIVLLLDRQVSAQLGGLFGGLGGLPQFPGLPQIPSFRLPQISSLVAPPGGGDPLSQVLGNLGALFQGISQPQVPPSPTLPPLPPPSPPPPLSPPTIPPFLPTEAATTIISTLESTPNAMFPTLVTELSVDVAEKVDGGQVSFLGIIPDEKTDYYTEENIDSMPDFTDMLSHGEHWTTEGKRNGKNSNQGEKSRSNINDGETGKQLL